MLHEDVLLVSKSSSISLKKILPVEKSKSELFKCIITVDLMNTLKQFSVSIQFKFFNGDEFTWYKFNLAIEITASKLLTLLAKTLTEQ